MKKNIINSLLLAFIYTTVLLGVAVVEVSNRHSPNAEEFGEVFFMAFAISSIAIFLLRLAFSYHKNMPNKGWQRVLIIVNVLVIPVSIYTGYKIEYVNNFADHICVNSIAISCTYLFIIGSYFGIKQTSLWVKSGFNETSS